ncbi:hypothetical protein ACFL5H_03330 [Candidatus Latescibacterota bacterium]
MINRSLLIIKAKHPFLDWLKSLPEPANISLEEVNWENSAFLLQDHDPEDQEEVLAHYYDIIFENELMGWWTDKEDWPKNRDLTLFKEWFDFEFHSMVFDLVDEPLLQYEPNQ